MDRIVLASDSPRRREILARLGIRFRALSPRWKEPEPAVSDDPVRYAESAARAKARSVVGLVDSCLVVGVDTVVALGKTILGKPRNRKDAGQMLHRLSGRTHTVTTGVAVIRIPGRRTWVASATSRVHFRRLKRAEVEDYLASDEPYDKAGAYAVQGRAAAFVDWMEGSYLNVVGLPATVLLMLLDRAGARL
ncbi:MAG: septum formation protein Maf [candidate division WOR-3 bacterium]|nr:MAG: septum formation protein Maf [candidate division WOR-3 bacterium]